MRFEVATQQREFHRQQPDRLRNPRVYRRHMQPDLTIVRAIRRNAGIDAIIAIASEQASRSRSAAAARSAESRRTKDRGCNTSCARSAASQLAAMPARPNSISVPSRSSRMARRLALIAMRGARSCHATDRSSRPETFRAGQRHTVTGDGTRDTPATGEVGELRQIVRNADRSSPPRPDHGTPRARCEARSR